MADAVAHGGLDARLRTVLTGLLDSDRIEAATIDAGRHSDYTGTVTTDTGTVFCKAVRSTDTRLAAMLAQEAAVTPLLNGLAPSLLADTEAGGWRVLLFEHVPGDHVDFTPGRTRLDLLTDLIDQLYEAALGVGDLEIPSLAGQWRRASPWRRLWADPPEGLAPEIQVLLGPAARTEDDRLAAVEGGRLAHTDLHALNLLIEGRTIRVVDWAWARTAPAWYDAAMLALRLIEAGHTPAAAMTWLRGTQPGADLTDKALHDLVIEAAGMWTWLAGRDTERPHLRDLATAALMFAAYLDD